MARPIAQAISLEKFCGTDRSAKTAKLFNLERFAIYCIYPGFKKEESLQLHSFLHNVASHAIES